MSEETTDAGAKNETGPVRPEPAKAKPTAKKDPHAGKLVEALDSFAGVRTPNRSEKARLRANTMAQADLHYNYAKGDRFFLPKGVDWLETGLCRLVRDKDAAPRTSMASVPV